ncbi:MAG: alpha/beta hydrolase [Alphaproteobacteria bacterium]
MKNGSPFGIVAVTAVLAAAPVAAEEIVQLETRPGVTVRVAVLEAMKEPVGTVILFPGGDGQLKLADGDAFLNKTGNFVIRARRRFAHAGFLTVSVDVPSDRDSLHDFRAATGHGTDIGRIIAWARARSDKPVWLIGFSRGSISAANGAAHLELPPGGPDGIVLMSSVTETSRDGKATIHDVDLKRIRVPVIVAHHRDDQCYVTPLYGARSLARKLNAKVIEVSGGKDPVSGPCNAKSQHGFFGVEKTIVREVVPAMRAAAGN